MKTITLHIPNKKYSQFVELAKNLRYVKKIELEDDEPTKEEILEGIKEGLKEVKLIQQGNIKATFLKDFLNEL